MTTKLIMKCDHHDYIEIACIYKIEVKLVLKGGKTLTGLPITTRVIKPFGECLELVRSGTSQLVSVTLTDLIAMKAVNANHHFDQISFE